MSYVKSGYRTCRFRKTTLLKALSRKMAKDYSMASSQTISTQREDTVSCKEQRSSCRKESLVETGGCPHTAIREDASMNLEAVDGMMERFPDIELLFIEAEITCLQHSVRNW